MRPTNEKEAPGNMEAVAHQGYPERTRYDKRARNYRYKYDFDFKKYHWNDLSLRERDYWRGRIQQDEQDRIRKYEPSRSKEKRPQGPTQGRIEKTKK
tara:strand:- start:218 stop:508 length:291 start_codon:yes stop_codon:yes gene_type:complete